jgi:hypothetical protein
VIEPPVAEPGQRVIDGPIKQGSELRWRIERANGEPAVLVQLVPELADDESVRRRYVYEAQRLGALDVPCVAPTLAIGPEPDPRDPAAPPPWRLRVAPPGETLAAWLDRRAPAPAEEALALIARIADAVHQVHGAGAVLRDLEPRGIVLGQDDTVWLTDILLARVDILSTRTASSLMLESSPYVAPEHLRSTVVDHRADVFTLGAMLWHALSGEPPFEGGLFRKASMLPPLDEVADVSAGVAALVASCLADDPDARPESARDVAEVLRGRAHAGVVALERVVCQACGEPMRPGLRLCLRCGKEAVAFTHVGDDTPSDQRYEVVLKSANDEAEFLNKLREMFAVLGEGPPPELAFLTGDARMYSKEERETLIRLPVALFTDLGLDTANRIAARMREENFKIAVRRADIAARGQRRGRRLTIAAGVLGGAGLIGAVATGSGILGAVTLGTAGILFIAGKIIQSTYKKKTKRKSMARLRDAPAALPASDTLVARIAAPLGEDELAADVRERISELALLVQRLVDHRAAHRNDADLALVTEPIEPLVGLVEGEIAAIVGIDRDLAELDEGTIVRAIAASEARREPSDKRGELLAGLDRLRGLEDDRGRHMQRLLEASSLIRRTVELGLSIRDAGNVEETSDGELRLALAALEQEL